MRRYRFRLEAVLRVRHVQEEAARGRLATATAAAHAALEGLDVARSNLAALVTQPAPRDAAAWAGRREVVLTGAREMSAATAHVAATRADQGLRQVELAAARTRVRALERLDERRREEHALAADREAGLVVDDLVTSRFTRGRR